MKKIGTRTYRGVIITPVLGGWTHRTIGTDPTGGRWDYFLHTKSLEAAKHSIMVEITSGRYEAIDGALVKRGA